MGYYTEFKFKAKLKQDTPQDVIDFLKRVIIDRDLGHDKVLFHIEDVFKPNLQHQFFNCERWYMLFLSTNWDDEKQGGRFYQEKNKWILDLHTEFKNYDNEIDKFIEWISPFVSGRKQKEYIGYMRGESMDSQINLYIERQLPINEGAAV